MIDLTKNVSKLNNAVERAKERRIVILTIFTDSMELYQSRLQELRKAHDTYTEKGAIRDFYGVLMSIKTANVCKLSYHGRKRIQNLKYLTWVEQQGKDVEELNAQWYEYPDYWKRIQSQVKDIDQLIEEFNNKTGFLKP